jgi:hypothetical protein
MTWGRKSAFLMLALMVFSAVMPAFACLLAMPAATGQQACCGSMVRGYAPAGTAANGSCCKVDPQNPPVTPVRLSASEHSQQWVFVPTQSNLQVPTSQGAACCNALEAPPPKSSPHGISILRI